MELPDLMRYLSNVQPRHRKITDVDFHDLIVYHLTAPENIDSIKQHGIIAKSSHQSYDRPSAVYFFVAKSDITKPNIDILGLSESYKIVRVKIPAKKVLENMYWDGLYNVSFDTSYSSVQYLGDIPVEWILDYNYSSAPTCRPRRQGER